MGMKNTAIAGLCWLICLLSLPVLAQISPSLSITPAAGEVEKAVFLIELDGLEAQSPYRIEIHFAGEAVYTTEKESDAAGHIPFQISSTPGDQPGVYSVRALHNDILVAQGEFELTAPAQQTADAQVAVMPPRAVFGRPQAIQIADLLPKATYTIEIIADDTRQLAYRRAHTSSQAGVIDFEILAQAGDTPGAHTIAVYDEAGSLVALGDFTIEKPLARDVRLELSPQSVQAGDSAVLQVDGLAAFDAVSAQLFSADGILIEALSTRASSDGKASLLFATSADLAEGAYTIALYVEGSEVATAGLIVGTAPTAETPASSTAQVIESRLQNGAAQVSFQGTAGRTIEIRVESAEFDPAAALIGQAGAVIVAGDDSRGSKQAILGPLVLPYNGSYQLEVSGAPLMMAQGADSGGFRVEIEEVRPVPLRSGETAFALTPESPRLYYRLSLAAGDTISASIDTGGSLDSLLQLVAPDGREVAFDDDSGGGLDAELSRLAIEQSGDYILVAASFDERVGGGVLRLERNPVRQLDEHAAAVKLNDKSVRERFVFDAVAGEMLILNISKRSGNVADLFVRASVEGMEVMSHSTMGVPDALPLPFVMPMSGQALLTLEKVGVDDGITLDVSLQRP